MVSHGLLKHFYHLKKYGKEKQQKIGISYLKESAHLIANEGLTLELF